MRRNFEVPPPCLSSLILSIIINLPDYQAQGTQNDVMSIPFYAETDCSDSHAVTLSGRAQFNVSGQVLYVSPGGRYASRCLVN